jgi:hypothetical protein
MGYVPSIPGFSEMADSGQPLQLRPGGRPAQLPSRFPDCFQYRFSFHHWRIISEYATERKPPHRPPLVWLRRPCLEGIAFSYLALSVEICRKSDAASLDGLQIYATKFSCSTRSRLNFSVSALTSLLCSI